MPTLVYAKQNYTVGVNVPSDYQAIAVTPADGSDLPNGPCAGLVCTVGGNVNVVLAGTGTAVLTTLVAGTIYDIPLTRILSTSTTATGIFALYRAGTL